MIILSQLQSIMWDFSIIWNCYLDNVNTFMEWKIVKRKKSELIFLVRRRWRGQIFCVRSRGRHEMSRTHTFRKCSIDLTLLFYAALTPIYTHMQFPISPLISLSVKWLRGEAGIRDSSTILYAVFWERIVLNKLWLSFDFFWFWFDRESNDASAFYYSLEQRQFRSRSRARSPPQSRPVKTAFTVSCCTDGCCWGIPFVIISLSWMQLQTGIKWENVVPEGLSAASIRWSKLLSFWVFFSVILFKFRSSKIGGNSAQVRQGFGGSRQMSSSVHAAGAGEQSIVVEVWLMMISYTCQNRFVHLILQNLFDKIERRCNMETMCILLVQTLIDSFYLRRNFKMYLCSLLQLTSWDNG